MSDGSSLIGLPDTSPGHKIIEFKHDIALDEKEHEKFSLDDTKEAAKSTAILYAFLTVPVLIIASYYVIIQNWLGPSWVWLTLFVVLPVILFLFLFSAVLDNMQ